MEKMEEFEGWRMDGVDQCVTHPTQHTREGGEDDVFGA